MFDLAEQCISAYPGLEVIIFSRIPRFDSTNIRIQDLGLDCYGPLIEKRYGTPGTRGFDGKFVDGIHMRGYLAVKHYTGSFVRMLRPSMANMRAGRDQQKSDFHASCPQTVYQRNKHGQTGQYGYRQRGGSTHQQDGYNTQAGRGFNRNNNAQFRNNHVGSQYDENVYNYVGNVYTIPVNNRFSKNF